MGGADAVDVMADIPWELKCPNVIGVKLTTRELSTEIAAGVAKYKDSLLSPDAGCKLLQVRFTLTYGNSFS